MAVAGAEAVVLAGLGDRFQYVEALRDVAERRVLRPELGVGVDEEELAAAGVRCAGVGHRDRAGRIGRTGEVLVRDRVARTAAAAAGRVTALQHEDLAR